MKWRNSNEIVSVLLRCGSRRHVEQCHAQLTTGGHLTNSNAVFFLNHVIRAHNNNTTSSTPVLSVFLHVLRSHRPDAYTFPPVLKACHLYFGLSLHALLLKSGFSHYLHVSNALIHFYVLLPNTDAALFLLRTSPSVDVVSYNTIITGYAKSITNMSLARKLFDEMPVPRDEVSWSAIISGYVQSGHSKEGLRMFSLMQRTEKTSMPGQATLVSVLAACAHLGELEQGKWVHGYYFKANGKGLNVFVGTALIDMYCKCGEVGLGLEVFRGMRHRNLLTWTTIIKGLAMHGQGREALQLFYDMQNNNNKSSSSAAGLVPDDIAFLGALCACTHAGLVDEGRRVFHSMTQVYGVRPKLEHYGCMVDLLARNGLLGDAMTMIQNMPMEPDALIWGALMAGCRFHGNVELAEVAVKHLVRLEPNKSGVYVLLANIYASSGRHQDARNIRLLMQSKGVEKTPGCSSIEVGGVVHQFLVGDTSHPHINEILQKWEEIERLIRLEGYVPHKKEVLLDVDDEEKDNMLSRHSEKLAIAFALLNTQPGITIRVVKNLRVCTDCHHVTKLISKVYNRKIVVRDRTRFHLFEGGSCTCNDYW